MGMLGGSIFDGVNSVNRNYQSYLGYFDPSTAGVGIDASAVASHITENFLLPVPEPAGPLLIGSAAVLLILHRRSSLGRG
jgi:hypothetical protein